MTEQRRRTTRRLAILGSTGSIGRQTLEVVEHLNALRAREDQPPAFEIVALAAGRDAAALNAQVRRWRPSHVALADPDADAPAHAGEFFHGPDAAADLMASVDADLVVAAIVGIAGLRSTLAAVERGIDVALANKETLVAAGAHVTPLARATGAALLPIDSEHAAIWQCLGEHAAPPTTPPHDVARVALTASGGPFRTWDADRIAAATPEQALEHPTWSMGAKVTIDCASLANKGLELIEAHWLFSLPHDRLDVVIHPQSIIHSIVTYTDASMIAQLGAPDMRTPIQHALTWPARTPGLAPPADLAALGALTFESPDEVRFPALRLAREVMRREGLAGAVFNGANEAGVQAFLDRRIPFPAVASLAEQALESLAPGVAASPPRDLDEILEADRAARDLVESSLDSPAKTD
jgi:1-deoxy-D-xylulose-5-phosphate reductoisomerase